MKKINLNGEWNLLGISPEKEEINICGTVPGNTLEAVLATMPDFDVFYRDNAELVQCYENYDWVYTKKFEIEDDEAKYELVFERLDTYCDVLVNGDKIASCQNGFIEHRFDISGKVVKGENTIEVRFYSPVIKVKDLPPRAFSAFSEDRLYTRREQCTYGWDWTMRFVTCGIGNAYIREDDGSMRVDDAYIYTKNIDSEYAELVADINFSNYDAGEVLTIELYSPDGELVCRKKRYNAEALMRVNMYIENPQLWYPNGYGDAKLYRFVIRSESEELFSEEVGIRYVKIMQLTDKTDSEYFKKCLEIKKTDFSEKYDLNEEFSGFIVNVNGEKIMCKGANWVPCEPLGIGESEEKITRLLTLAKEAGLNIIRVWGGGVFECEHFYKECSRLGLMVCQDFLMACGDYPEEQEWFADELRQEAEYAIKLIRNKACLVWWNGDNENAGWGTPEMSEHHGRISGFKILAPVIYKLDYTRDFLPSSPFGGYRYASSTVGTTHNTQFLSFLFDYIEESDMADFKDKLKEYSARFIAEEPAMGATELSSLKKFMTDEDIFGDDKKMWLYHTKNNPSLKTELFDYELMMSEKLFGKFADGRDRLFKLKYLQYEWMRIGFEKVRREKWFSSGIIYWMFNDCWPAASGWAFVDYYCMPKAVYYSFKRGAKPVIGAIDYEDGEYKLYVCNDGKAQKAKVKCVTVSGKTIIPEREIEISANSSEMVFEVKESLGDDMMIMEIRTEDGSFDRAFYKHGKLIINPCDGIEVQKTANSITVSAKNYVHAVELEGEAVFEDNYFSLMPGEERTIRYDGSGEITVCGYTI